MVTDGGKTNASTNPKGKTGMPKWGWWLLGSILFVTVVTIVIIILIRKSRKSDDDSGAGPTGPAPTSSGPGPTSSGPGPTSSGPTSSGPGPTSSGPGPTSPGPTSSDPDNTTPIGPGNAQCIMDSSLSNCYSINTESYDYSSIRGPNVPHDATGNDPPYTVHHTPIITGTFIIMDGMARPTRAGLITVLPVVANRRTITRKIGTVVTS
jgi:hypothetical protein